MDPEDSGNSEYRPPAGYGGDIIWLMTMSVYNLTWNKR